MKIINEANENRISYRLLNVMLKLEEAQERLHRYGTDTPLFAAEIHMIKCVKENPNRHMTALAEVLGVTRGAVSQIAMKLEGKGMLVKERDEDSSLRRILRVTPEGERAYLFHERLHAKFDRLVEGLLADASERDRDFLRDFLGALDAALEGRNEEGQREKPLRGSAPRGAF